MDFEYTEEQKMVRRNVRAFLDKEVEPHIKEFDKQPFTHDQLVEWRRKLEPIGFGAMDFTAMAGQQGVDPITNAIVGEEVFGCWVGVAAAIGLAGAASMVAFGSDKMRARLGDRFKAGELIGCGGLTEPNAGSDNRAMTTRAVLNGDHYVINGTKTWVSNAQISDMVMLLCKDENDQLTQILIDKEESPYETGVLHKLGWRACPIGELYFDNCRVPKENNLMNIFSELMSSGNVEQDMVKRGLPPDTMTRMGHMFARGPLGLLAYARTGIGQAGVGISSRATEAAISYAKERVQFGRPIASRQLIQNMITEMVFITESCRLLVYRTVIALDKATPDFRMLSSLVKAYVAEATVNVTSMALQVHGANGLSEDLPLERYFRDARTFTIPDGTTEINKLVAGKELLGVSAYV
ncbi:MAG: acyl-CoA dehydrogenase family protein [Chloroflexota bacterium]|nr:acyl-CoA dehydrogenase family protein [Chloroflexota bacterium]